MYNPPYAKDTRLTALEAEVLYSSAEWVWHGLAAQASPLICLNPHLAVRGKFGLHNQPRQAAAAPAVQVTPAVQKPVRCMCNNIVKPFTNRPLEKQQSVQPCGHYKHGLLSH